MSASGNTNALTALRAFGDELRRLRTGAGFRTQESAAAKLKCSQSKVSYVEAGKRWPDDDLLRKMFRVYGVDASTQADIRASVRAGQSLGRPWWDTAESREVFPGTSMQFFALEDVAETMWVHSGNYVPGLLQTRAYIEALVEFGQREESAAHRRLFVEARLKRQHVLARQHPPTLHAFVLEAALRVVVGGRDVMREQLGSLRAAVQRPHVTLRVVPFSAGAAATLGAPFQVYDFPGADRRSVTVRETSRSDEVTDEEGVVEQMRRRFVELAAAACSPEESVQLLEGIEKEL
ncbi:helix-turn-helix domain-containing protein [Streptomyces paludis]|uniref:helix-turn-helix domain-containing protein n=1 Tax=Streptomyces paludis TaxID=2282738 RepID=UPI0013B45C61|nr:helix-turn-helix transcriptional regulator [Streptomyces paludis]